MNDYALHIITAVASALTVGVPSWITSFILFSKLKTERNKTVAETRKTESEALAIETDNFLKLFSEFQKFRKEFEALSQQLDLKDAHIANLVRVIGRMSSVFREFLDDNDLGFWEADATGKRINFNRAWLEITGMSFREACGTGWQKCIHPDDLERLIDRDEAMMFVGATIRPVQCRIVNQKTGDVISVLKTLYPVYNSDGTVYRFYGKVRQI